MPSIPRQRSVEVEVWKQKDLHSYIPKTVLSDNDRASTFLGPEWVSGTYWTAGWIEEDEFIVSVEFPNGKIGIVYTPNKRVLAYLTTHAWKTRTVYAFVASELLTGQPLGEGELEQMGRILRVMQALAVIENRYIARSDAAFHPSEAL